MIRTSCGVQGSDSTIVARWLPVVAISSKGYSALESKLWPVSSYRVVVQNPDAASANRIHSDEVARAHGFRGALVPGVVTYALMCPAVVVALGSEWLDRGEASVRFTKPVYDGDEIEISSELSERGALVQARNQAGEVCATLDATLPAARATPGEPSGLRLTALRATLGADDAGPAGVLRLANRLVTMHFDISPWIHAGSRVRHWRELVAGQEVEVQAVIASLSERGGHKLVELDLQMLAGGAPAAQVRHTVIYRLAAREAAP